MQKIVITGGLGYIGTELCKLYSGEARYKNITVIDSRFVSERVKQLRDWDINFIQASILDEDILKTELGNADVIIHLAGVTDVAYTKTESNEQLDNNIKKIGIDGTRNIIKYSGKNTKIVFPSTHVVYEGLLETKVNVSEDETACPVLTYSSGKVQSEIDLFESDRNFVILRLASVYGYSTDTMRIGIMPNLFSKIASQNGTIKMFSGGVQLKSLVPLIDVARCMKFMAENDKISRELFHCSKENMSVKEVAIMCKEINPKVTLIETNDEIPNLGYTISNEKLLSTGFSFIYNLRDSLKEMISNWSHKELPQDLEYIITGGKEYVDSRGKISNYELTEPINLIGYIESVYGSVRANHYHPIQEQKCLLVKGQYISVIKDLSIPNAPIETRIINEGDIAVIKPNVAHAMIFTQDSIFLNLVRGEREHENYGVTHTIPYILVNEQDRIKLLESHISECRSCGNKHLKRVISLGNTPLANNLTNSPNEQFDEYPLEMNYCPNCHNCQLSYVVPPKKMFDNYLYVSSTSELFRNHFQKAAKKYVSEFNLNETSVVLDIGSNDGVFLSPLMSYGVKVIGVEPAANIAKLANGNGIYTLNAYFNDELIGNLYDYIGKIDLITASNVFAHSDELISITRNVFKLLKSDGVFIIEVQYLLDTIKDLTFDNIYHEHVNYWSVISLVNFFTSLGYKVTNVEHIDTHGGSIRVYIQNESAEEKRSVGNFINIELENGLNDFQVYKEFSKKIEQLKINVVENFKFLKSLGKKIVGYGSPAKATTALTYFGIDNTYIDYIIEDNELKNGKYIPKINLPIVNKNYSFNHLPDIIVVLAWNFFDVIVKNNQFYTDKNKHINIINIKDLQTPNFNYGLPSGDLEKKILNYFKHIKNGVFVEAGALNGLFQSNTKFLEYIGWSGLLVEPSREAFNQCKQNRNSIVENYALVASDEVEVVLGDFLYDGSGGLGARSKIGGPDGTIAVNAKTLKSLLEKHNITHVNFLSLDVEEYEMEVLKGIDFDNVLIDFILIEVNTNSYSLNAINSFMLDRGYQNIKNVSSFTSISDPRWLGNHQDYLYKKV